METRRQSSGIFESTELIKAIKIISSHHCNDVKAQKCVYCELSSLQRSFLFETFEIRERTREMRPVLMLGPRVLSAVMSCVHNKYVEIS